MAGSERISIPFLSRRHIERIDAAELTHAVAASVRRTIERCGIIDYAIPDGVSRPAIGANVYSVVSTPEVASTAKIDGLPDPDPFVAP